jgi:prepilin-type processing-associated H-X9-DG protein
MSRRSKLVDCLVGIGAIALLISIILPTWNRWREAQQGGRDPCASRLRQIGQAILLYANDNHGLCPPSLASLVKGDGLSQEVLICPWDRSSHADGESTYVYLGSGKRFNDLTVDDVLVYEPTNVHEEGGNVLFGDGHVSFVDLANYDAIKTGVYRTVEGPTSQSH